ncbi:MAG: hypothetical protein COA83_04320 [Methylophaga sp.]|nr:MAG: hypothetical protein COA83_04320 [Methylophaga sp.]
MTLSKLKQTEQILLATVIVVLILGAYSLLRFIPENKTIVTLQKQAERTAIKLQTARIPDEPEQDVEELLHQLDEQEQVLALINTMADNTTQRLAPFGSQQLMVRISELARTTRMRIRSNEAYQAINRARATKFKSSLKSKSRPKARVVTTEVDAILPENYNWIDRMSAKTMFHRPIQRLVLEGDYQSLRAFIHGLEGLEWQVTVVQLNIELMPAAPMRGYAQLLRSELVLAL